MEEKSEFLGTTNRELAPLDVWHPGFRNHPVIAALLDDLTSVTAEHAALSEHYAAAFVLGELLKPHLLRRRPRAMTENGVGAPFLKHGNRWRLSSVAVKKIRGAFRRPPGERVYHVYLNVPELQAVYPAALLPLGQAHFATWLTTHGREDFGLTSTEIVWFFFQSATQLQRGLVLTYLIRPHWQKEFPFALTATGWGPFLRALRNAYGRYFPARRFGTTPGVLSATDTRLLRQRSKAIEGVNVLSHFCNPSGIQQAALWTKAALERVGLATSCRDVPVPRRIVPKDREDWLGLEVFPVTILTHAATPYFESGYERAGLLRGKNIYRIAYWAWELETVPDEWVQAAALVDEIWAPTEFVARTMRRQMPRPVFRMLPGVEVGPIEAVARSDFGIPEDHFVFLFMFDLHSQMHRKNPVGVFHAFREAFRDDDKATLLIKSTGGDIHWADLAVLREIIRGRNIILLDRLMTRPQTYGLIAMADCFVSLHRSEGFGLGLAEAMLLGKPVIATGYSGNLDFMTPDNSLLVDYEMTEITEDRPIYTRGNVWAEPSVLHATALMRDVYKHPEEAHARARRVQPQIQEWLSLDAAGRRMRGRLEQILAK